MTAVVRPYDADAERAREGNGRADDAHLDEGGDSGDRGQDEHVVLVEIGDRCRFAQR